MLELLRRFGVGLDLLIEVRVAIAAMLDEPGRLQREVSADEPEHHQGRKVPPMIEKRPEAQGPPPPSREVSRGG
jgi:hypothetical protein